MCGTIPCGKCVQVNGRSCCEGNQVLLTSSDEIRMKKYLSKIGKTKSFPNFAVLEDVSPDLLLGENPTQEECSWYELTTTGGKRRVIRGSGNGKCMFLTEYGCTFMESARPLVCRLFPLKYNAVEMEEGLEDGCWAVREGIDIREAFGYHSDTTDDWRRQLYHELKEDKAYRGTGVHPHFENIWKEQAHAIECNRCGKCCQAFPLPMSSSEIEANFHAVLSGKENYFVLDEDGELYEKPALAHMAAWSLYLEEIAPPTEYIDNKKEGVTLSPYWYCCHLYREVDGKGVCTKHDFCPQTCSRYRPFFQGGYIGSKDAIVYPECSYLLEWPEDNDSEEGGKT